MIAIHVHVEQLGSGIAGDQVHDLGSAAFTRLMTHSSMTKP
jgi:hypothetical protein